MTNQISRRSLIASTLAGGAALAASPLMAHGVDKNIKWDETYDVIVIGSGFAGLAAAIEAKNAGANVVVLEKMTTFGGNSIINGGILTATGCPQQKMHKIEDSVDLLEKDILVASSHFHYLTAYHLGKAGSEDARAHDKKPYHHNDDRTRESGKSLLRSQHSREQEHKH